MRNTTKILCHKYNANKFLEDIKNWKIKEEIKKKVLVFLKKYHKGEITGNVISEGSIMKNASSLKIAIENIKSYDVMHISKFKEDLIKDKIKNIKGESFALRTKKDVLNLLMQFIGEAFPQEAINLKSVLNIKIKSKKKDIETLTDEEVNKMLNETEPIDKKFLLTILNDSGMRAEEFHNTRYSDYTLPTGKEMYVKVNIRNEFSKTQGRNISLFGKNTLKIVKEYLAQRLEEGMKPEDPVFPITYYSTRKWMARHGKKILGRRVYYHLWRHTSATRLASKLNRQQLCIYFGWKFSSPMPDIYIQRSGVNMVDVESKFANADIEEVQKEMSSMKEDNEILNEMMGLFMQGLITKKDFDRKKLVNLYNKLGGEQKLGKIE